MSGETGKVLVTNLMGIILPRTVETAKHLTVLVVIQLFKLTIAQFAGIALTTLEKLGR